MEPAVLSGAARGSVLAAIVFVLVLSSVPVSVQATTSSGYFFTMTLLAPTSSPFRRQWAALVTDSLRQINIDARLLYVSFGTMAALTFGCSLNNCGKTFDQGGFDAMFVGLGGGPTILDWPSVVLYKSSSNGDYSPNGGNFFFYHNDTYNQLDAQYSNEFNATARVAIAQQMVRIVAQDRPDMPLFYPVDVFGISNYINQWNGKAVETDSTVTRDFQHWGVSHGGSINIAEEGSINSADQWVTSAYNARFDGYLYNPTVSTLEELDARTFQFSRALARSITYSSDHLTWTITFRPHTFQDGVNVTADDYLFAMMGSTINDVGHVGAGDIQGLLGGYGQRMCNCTGIRFTYLNGTSDYVWNGNYTHKSLPGGFITTSNWTAINDTSFAFTLSNSYTFTDPVLTSFAAEPMHIFETIPFSQWESSPFATLHYTPYVYTYNHIGQANHGGNGSAIAYGPIGDGPYYYHGYDLSNGVGTLVKWAGYWNASGLERIGLFNASTIRVLHIATRDAAIVAFQAGQVNFLDDNYEFYYPDFANLGPINGHLTQSPDANSGFQDFVLQNVHPVFGTGAATPNGRLDPTHAEVYARYIRAAISHAVPRQYIVDTFLEGHGSIGVTEVCTCFKWAYPADVTPDTYDLGLARSFLAKAGFSDSAPSIATLPITPQFSCSSPVTGNTTVNLANAEAGNPVVSSGTFAIRPAVGNGTGGFYAILQQSTDNGSSWVPVAMTVTTTGGYYTLSYSPAVTGKAWFRIFFTGIPYNSLVNFVYLSPYVVESYAPPLSPQNGQHSRNVTDTQYGSVTKLDIETFTEIVQGVLTAASAGSYKAIHDGLCGFQASTNASISSFGASIGSQVRNLSQNSASKTDLNNAVNSLNGKLAAITNLSYVALAAALTAGLVAIVIARRSKSGPGGN